MEGTNTVKTDDWRVRAMILTVLDVEIDFSVFRIHMDVRAQQDIME